ncbi:hypothetical protein BaRGS_00038563 [Batillaria attramentaria]|uniref:Uncharacterized protein n=1 Tax=Batillaria attramentaria TaxID=370345 RepID=A0ABD0J5Y2_9CAEN
MLRARECVSVTYLTHTDYNRGDKRYSDLRVLHRCTLSISRFVERSTSWRRLILIAAALEVAGDTTFSVRRLRSVYALFVPAEPTALRPSLQTRVPECINLTNTH